jgi:ribosomal protein S18 acetylase RimI-like enzyme
VTPQKMARECFPWVEMPLPVTALHTYRSDDVAAMAEVWNEAFAGGPNFVRLQPADLRRRVIDQPAFDAKGVLVAARGDRTLGFVHFGPRTNHWSRHSERAVDRSEGHIYALVAPESERALSGDLLAAAVEGLHKAGARRVLLGPSWVHGTQPFYNGIAGAYEMPGISARRRGLLELASEHDFKPTAEYGTPELDLLDGECGARLTADAEPLWERAREWGLHRTERHVRSDLFPPRTLVELGRGHQTIAMTAYGLWPEYEREYGRRLFGLTNVQVAADWRGRGIGKLVVICALEAALKAGAEAAHLHVWRENAPAWNLYHRALGFQPRYTWLTLAKEVR